MTVNAGDIVRGDMFYESPGASVQMNVFYWRMNGAGMSDAAFIAFIDAWATTVWGVPWQALADDGCVLGRVELKKVLPSGVVLTGIGTATIAIPGGVTGDVTSAAVAGFIQSDVVDSTLKGRKYVPGVSEFLISDGIITPTGLGLLVDLLDAWQASPDADEEGDIEPVIISRGLGLIRSLANTGMVTDVPAYQRRRKPNVGI